MALLRSGTRIYGNAIVDTVLTVSGNTPATNSTSGAIVVTGGIGTGGNIFSAGNVIVSNDISANNAIFSGNVIINGNILYSNVETLNIKDSLIEQGGTVDGTALDANDGKDRGQLLHYFTTEAVDAFMGWDNSNAEFALASNVSVNNNVVTFNEYGNLRASYFVGNGSALTDITAGNIVGTVAFANHANISDVANSVSGSNVTSQVANALIAGTVFTNAQPNITSLGTLSGLSVAGPTSLGPVGNVSILGGSSGYVLSTDGVGNLSWVEQTGGSSSNVLPSVTVDSFVADGETNSFQLSVTPASKDLIFVNIDGVFQIRDSFDLFSNAISFGSTPVDGSVIEVSTFVVGAAGSGSNIDLTSVSSNIVPSANVTYDLGSPTNRWRDLYLSGNTIDLGGTLLSADAANNTVTLGNVSISHDGNGGVSVGNILLDSSLSNVSLTQDSFLPFNLTITPEVLSIQVQANEAGDNIRWLWTWQQSTLPYARATITNQFQPSVPLYFQGTYQLDNFADTIYGDMTQAHKGYFKWVEGAGLDNQISWATTYTEVSSSHPDINGGTPVTVQRYTFQVPSSITIPTLTAPSNVGYQVSFANAGAYTFGASMMNGSMMDNVAEGENPSIGPMYRGGTYTFHLDSSLENHPFYLTTDSGQNFIANAYVGEYTSGVTGSRNNGTSGKETITFTVPMNAPDTLYYQCGAHAAMHGAITIKNLEVTTNINGNYIVYFQHMHEGHVTPIELRPIPALVNQMCLVYDAVNGNFVPQDLATYVENTPSFKNKIREVAGTATLVAPDGVAVVPTVLTVEDSSYLPIIGNNDGDIAFDAYTNTVYVWYGNQWKNTKPASVATPTALSSTVDTFTGNGTDTTYSLSVTPADKNFTILIVDGVAQPKSAYTISGTTLALSSAAPEDAIIEITTFGGNASAPTQTIPDILSPFMFIGL